MSNYVRHYRAKPRPIRIHGRDYLVVVGVVLGFVGLLGRMAFW